MREPPRIREDRPPPAGCRRVKVPALPTSSRLPSGPLLRWRGEVGGRSCASSPSCLHFSRTVESVSVLSWYRIPDHPIPRQRHHPQTRHAAASGVVPRFELDASAIELSPDFHVTVCARLDFTLYHVLTIRACGAPALWPKKPFFPRYKTLQIALWHLRTQALFIRLPHEQIGPTAAYRGRCG